MALKKKPPEAEKENGERWLVSYADFMTLLLGLFIILYSKAAAEAGALGSTESYAQAMIAGMVEGAGGSASLPIFNSQGSSIIDGYSGSEMMDDASIESSNMELVEQEVEELAKELDITDSLEVVVDETGVHIRITDTVLFNSGSYIINKNAEHILTRIGNIIKTLPNNYIQIEGHTDNIPINKGLIASNWELGALRAVTVSKLLISDCALSPTYVSAVSYGEFKPIADNDTAEGRATNRRVEISILRNHTEKKVSTEQ